LATTFRQPADNSLLQNSKKTGISACFFTIYTQVKCFYNCDTITKRVKKHFTFVIFIVKFRNMQDKFLKLTNTVYRILEFFPESDPLKNRAKDRALAIMEHLILINETSGWASFQKEKVKVQLSEDIDILLGYLWIGKSQGWLNSVNCLIIANEYEKIKKEIAPILEPIMEFTKKLPLSSNNFEIKEKEAVAENHLKIPGEETQNAPEPVLNNTEPKTPDFSLPLTNFRVEEKEVSIVEKTPKLVRGESDRQKKILEFLSKNEKAQVMDLQTILPDITKRTIRRDLDELLEIGKIIRLGDFNHVFYKISGSPRPAGSS